MCVCLFVRERERERERERNISGKKEDISREDIFRHEEEVLERNGFREIEGV